MSPRLPLPWRVARRRVVRDVEDEILGHIELKARDLERAGASPEEAWARASAAFGRAESIRTECRTIQNGILRARGRTMRYEELRGDVARAGRGLIRAPGFTFFAAVTLALGVAANTSVFSVAHGLFARSLPGIRDPGHLVEVTRGPGYVSVSYPMYERFSDAPGLTGLAAFDVVGLSMERGEGGPEVVMGLQVTGNYFDVLGTRPALGRFFAGSERDPTTRPAVAVLSHRLWVERFDANTGVVGSSIHLNGLPVTVVGVAEPGFQGHIAPATAEIFMPLGAPLPGFHTPASLDQVDAGILELVGRTTPDTDPETLSTRLGEVAEARLRAEGPGPGRYVAHVERYAPVPGFFRGPARVFFAIMTILTGLLLLIACLNVAGLLLSRAERRRQEMAIRLSLGAGRARLVRQLLAEALALALLSGAAAIVLTFWITRALGAFQMPVAPLPGLRLDLHLVPNGTVLAYSLLLASATGVTFGLAPALRATRLDVVNDLRDVGGTKSPRRTRLQAWLVGAQMAGSIVLLTASGLFLRALVSAREADLGFDTADVYLASFDLELAGLDPVTSSLFYDELVHRVSALPGVTSASVAGKPPLAGLSQMAPVNFEGVAPPPGRDGYVLANQSVGPGYFRTLGIPIREGRSITSGDVETSRPVVVVNEHLAQSMWPGAYALGRSITVPFGPRGPQAFEVVGVAATARYSRPNEAPRSFAYFAASQRPRADMMLHVKMTPGAAPPFGEIRSLASELEPAAATLSTGSLESAVGLFLLPQRAGAWVTGVVGLFGLLLGGLGVYGLTAYRVIGATREIGIRMALGASAGEVLSGVVRSGLGAPLAGGAVGLVLAGVAARFLEAFLYGVNPLDPLTFGAVIGTLAVCSLAANLVPAARAARLDPARVLRGE